MVWLLAIRIEHHGEEHVAPEMRTIYVCPTDADVVSDSPGACPTGDEKLVAKEIPVPVYAPLAINGRILSADILGVGSGAKLLLNEPLDTLYAAAQS